MNGVDLPHDCRSGVCGACRVRLVSGSVFGGHERGDDMIHACQARILSDIEIMTEPVPDPITFAASVTDVVRLAPDVVGVAVRLPNPLQYLPGQYCKLQFRGFPARLIRWREARKLDCCIFTFAGFRMGWCLPLLARKSRLGTG